MKSAVVKSAAQSVIRPDFARAGEVGSVKASTWRLGTPERQRAAVDAIAGAWERRPWPAAALLSYTVLAGTDGDSLFHFSQWADGAAYEEFFRTSRDERNAEVDAAVPGIVRVGLDDYRPYRSVGTAAATPGCVVVVEAAFDPAVPDAARAFADLVLDARATDPAPAAGGLSGNFHLSPDGTRMLNYAEWDSEQAHAQALASPGPGVGSDTGQWRRVLDFAALGTNGFRRYVPALALVPRP
ncbi:antibiotic biosynthesis monooxygenase [Streptomyces sp. NPDC058612]|uniref:antibiotic biosynthesis monooxygenase n=1 Tax=Streptomyces sp. NPDC058612 TaxID=3346555 RepID=UPI003668AD94